MIDADTRARWRELAEKASPGPWEWEWIRAEGSLPVATLKGPIVLCRYWEGWSLQHAGEMPDADFLAAAREAVPALLGALEGAEREIVSLRGDLYGVNLKLEHVEVERDQWKAKAEQAHAENWTPTALDRLNTYAREHNLAESHQPEELPALIDRVVFHHMGKVRTAERERDALKADNTDLLAERDAMQSIATQAGRERDWWKARAETLEREMVAQGEELKRAREKLGAATPTAWALEREGTDVLLLFWRRDNAERMLRSEERFGERGTIIPLYRSPPPASRTYKGRPLCSEAEIAKQPCPFPPEPGYGSPMDSEPRGEPKTVPATRVPVPESDWTTDKEDDVVAEIHAQDDAAWHRAAKRGRQAWARENPEPEWTTDKEDQITDPVPTEPVAPKPERRHDGDCGIYDAELHICTCGYFHYLLPRGGPPPSEGQNQIREGESRRVLSKHYHSGMAPPPSAAEYVGSKKIHEELSAAFGVKPTGNAGEPSATGEEEPDLVLEETGLVVMREEEAMALRASVATLEDKLAAAEARASAAEGRVAALMRLHAAVAEEVAGLHLHEHPRSPLCGATPVYTDPRLQRLDDALAACNLALQAPPAAGAGEGGAPAAPGEERTKEEA